MQVLRNLVLSMLVLCGTVSAQIPTKGSVFFGYSFDHTAISAGDSGSLNGWDASLEGKFLPWIGLVADIDGHYRSRDGVHVTAHNFLFGPRVSVQVERFRPFAELLVGAGHVNRSHGINDSNTSFVSAIGGGLDYRVAGPLTLRGQLDWINTRFYGQGQNGVRFTTGIAFHF